MPHLEGIKVVCSEIHGYGLVALRPFKAGETLVYGDGILYDEDDDFDDTYALVYSDENDQEDYPNRYLDLTCQTRWINHACSPNCEVDTDIDPDTGDAYATWIALRDIAVGEELTYDYAFAGHLAEPCNCKHSVCLGLIVDPEDLDAVPAKLRKYIDLSKLAERKAQIQLADL